MALLAAVTFRKIGKLHYYPADAYAGKLEVGSRVVAETERGAECGEVKILRDVEGYAHDAKQTFQILRLASDEDVATIDTRLREALESQTACQEKADSLLLAMKIVDAEISLDGQQVTFYFVADTRVDFRQLVKEVAAKMRMRVHLHQVGSRDHAKALGGYGPCGRPLCCTTFLRDFAPVSMKMAKDQSLYLNPSKFSGVCGKLMCCLRFEHDVYLEAKDRLPSPGMSVSTPEGERGVIIDLNIFKETVTVEVRDEEGSHFVSLKASDVNIARACGDCGSAGGGCGGSCGPSGGCGVPAKVEPKLVQLERWKKNWG
jgi:cell fate regulator YaaT (PSP1 superfamily)